MASGNGIWVMGVSNTSNLECKVCKGWLNHWKKLAGCNKVNCCHPAHERTGGKIADSGVHVKKCSTNESEKTSKELFIIPVCKEHIITKMEAIYISDKMLGDAEPCNPRTIEPRKIKKR